MDRLLWDETGDQGSSLAQTPELPSSNHVPAEVTSVELSPVAANGEADSSDPRSSTVVNMEVQEETQRRRRPGLRQQVTPPDRWAGSISGRD